MSSCTHTHVCMCSCVPKLYDFLFTEHKRRNYKDCWYYNSIYQYYSPHQASCQTLRPRPKHFTLWLDSRLPHWQTTSGENGMKIGKNWMKIQLHHPEHRSPTGLCPELYSLYTHDCVSSHSSTSIVKFADDTVVLGLISNNDETAYLDEVERLTSWCQDNCLSLNVSKTKELIVDFRKRQQRPYTPLMISGTPVERVNSFKYLGVNISEDLRGPS